VNLNGAYFPESSLFRANLEGANLSQAILTMANLLWANLRRVISNEADMTAAIMSGATLCNAKLSGSNLSEVNLVDANLENADITGCRVYGVSAWGVKLKDAKQEGLIITQPHESAITVDNLEVAQFIYLLLHNENIRGVIDTIARKAVLILGRFTPERKAVLDALRIELRNRNYLPIIFDFDKPATKDFTETIRILAGMSLFVIADISNPKSSPLELQATIPDYMVPFVPIIQEDEEPFSMFKDLHIKYKKWVLAPLKYDSREGLIRVLDEAIIKPALKVHSELALRCFTWVN
jgi:hypothetical protein